MTEEPAQNGENPKKPRSRKRGGASGGGEAVGHGDGRPAGRLRLLLPWPPLPLLLLRGFLLFLLLRGFLLLRRGFLALAAGRVGDRFSAHDGGTLAMSSPTGWAGDRRSAVRADRCLEPK